MPDKSELDLNVLGDETEEMLDSGGFSAEGNPGNYADELSDEDITQLQNDYRDSLRADERSIENEARLQAAEDADINAMNEETEEMLDSEGYSPEGNPGDYADDMTDEDIDQLNNDYRDSAWAERDAKKEENRRETEYQDIYNLSDETEEMLDTEGYSPEGNPGSYADELTDEDVKQIKENDAGYVDGTWDGGVYSTDENGYHDVKWAEDREAMPDEGLNTGAVPGTEKQTQLQPGEFVERYGSEKGGYLTPEGEDPDSLAMAQDAGEKEHHKYMVMQPMDVTEAEVADQFGMENGGGTQYKLNGSVEDMTGGENPYLVEVDPETNQPLKKDAPEEDYDYYNGMQ